MPPLMRWASSRRERMAVARSSWAALPGQLRCEDVDVLEDRSLGEQLARSLAQGSGDGSFEVRPSASLSGKKSTIANVDSPVLIANQATVSGSSSTSGNASTRNDASSCPLPAIASSLTIRPLVTIRVLLLVGVFVRRESQPRLCES